MAASDPGAIGLRHCRNVTRCSVGERVVHCMRVESHRPASGDGGAWIAQGHFTRDTFRDRIDALAHEVAAGVKPGRTSPSERIVAIVQGMAIGDIAFSAFALQEAERLGRGLVVELP